VSVEGSTSKERVQNFRIAVAAVVPTEKCKIRTTRDECGHNHMRNFQAHIKKEKMCFIIGEHVLREEVDYR
jgi:hypothetical protein